ncbi:hypothetical protein GLOIN_2v1522404 [Rhizophagus irregularis DAOM 181602=DAOM 197198]|uniref:Secreted peptide n=1 Tax=Rhizophagus irregularis (strain DAOM 181602 / DAOM 197198 / MUCL 43194) TaxID=747089 RepID=A0A2P4QQQ1_RHIID|nr:hypothetical protein GLOIN_2v1522404 [Rhizophagus irregularis DAOM 181602=DAOM 197198]POG79945.1 hypothetical protein GLOIN_2v1522404 [Rhizophagus irregularis DAOM 181602=DAOM 197198]|eukprot:XP_025186811.1 hypothetical protein GLOIN_2v1522404 [Rhizophagus irregularis DAOM 181602=DAOM 197198]
MSMLILLLMIMIRRSDIGVVVQHGLLLRLLIKNRIINIITICGMRICIVCIVCLRSSCCLQIRFVDIAIKIVW